MRALSDADVRALRMRAQGLTGEPAADVVSVVRALGGVQAQDWRFAPLAIRARSRGLVAADVDRARNDERSIVWTWAMRGTLHLVAAEDAAWMVGLLGPVFAVAGRRRRLALGLDDALCGRALPAIRAVLGEHGPLTRAALVQRLRERGVTIDPSGRAPAHLVAYAAMAGLICRATPVGDEPTYALLEDWLGAPSAPPAPPVPREPDSALAELARRYVAAHGPATAHDFAVWSGLGIRRARQGFTLVDVELREVATTRGPAWMRASADQPPPAIGRSHAVLLGHFDPYLLGYRSRDLILDPRFAKRIQAGGGFIQPALLAHGHLAGTWRTRRRGSALSIAVEPFERLEEAIEIALGDERADVARFLAAELS